MYNRIALLESRLDLQEKEFTKQLEALSALMTDLRTGKSQTVEEKIISVQNTLQSLEKLMHI